MYLSFSFTPQIFLTYLQIERTSRASDPDLLPGMVGDTSTTWVAQGSASKRCHSSAAGDMKGMHFNPRSRMLCHILNNRRKGASPRRLTIEM